MLETILALAIPVVSLITSIVNLVKAIIEFKNKQKK